MKRGRYLVIFVVVSIVVALAIGVWRGYCRRKQLNDRVAEEHSLQDKMVDNLVKQTLNAMEGTRLAGERATANQQSTKQARVFAETATAQAVNSTRNAEFSKGNARTATAMLYQQATGTANAEKLAAKERQIATQEYWWNATRVAVNKTATAIALEQDTLMTRDAHDRQTEIARAVALTIQATRSVTRSPTGKRIRIRLDGDLEAIKRGGRYVWSAVGVDCLNGDPPPCLQLHSVEDDYDLPKGVTDVQLWIGSALDPKKWWDEYDSPAVPASSHEIVLAIITRRPTESSSSGGEGSGDQGETPGPTPRPESYGETPGPTPRPEVHAETPGPTPSGS